MLSLSQLVKLRPQPYHKPLKAKVVSIGPKLTYTNKKGQDYIVCNIGLADETTTARGKLNNDDLQLDEGKCYYFRNYTLEKQGLGKKDKTVNITLTKVTKASKVPPSAEINVPEHIEQQAMNLVVEEAEEKTLAEVKRSPQKMAVSVRGRVIQVSKSRPNL